MWMCLSKGIIGILSYPFKNKHYNDFEMIWYNARLISIVNNLFKRVSTPFHFLFLKLVKWQYKYMNDWQTPRLFKERKFYCTFLKCYKCFSKRRYTVKNKDKYLLRRRFHAFQKMLTFSRFSFFCILRNQWNPLTKRRTI